jgi:NADH:ubiquinone oxidoreductase subunit F (NADH-binding)/NADH:ubiquinone oxidoreductase subunit E
MSDNNNLVNELGRPPGSRRGKPPHGLKGRQADDSVRAEVREILGSSALQRDRLLEYLHAIQDATGRLSVPRLTALAAEMRLAQAEVYEVATFYHAFDVVRENEDGPAELTVRVCDSLSCELAGARQLADELTAKYGANVRVIRAACMGRCDQAPVASVARNYLPEATAASVSEAVESRVLTSHPVNDFIGLDAYRSAGGYRLLEACRQGERSYESVCDALDAAGLRGLGGAGFPTGRKWRAVRNEPAPRLMAVNADESEPGTFKDRWYLEHDPHRFIEGMLIAAGAVRAERIYIYLRTEYPHLHDLLKDELKRIADVGLCPLPVEIRRGAGAYICGEESAMLESIEGKRGLPRHKPPYPSQVGLFGRPTLINNVETLYWVRDCVEAPERFTAEARNGARGQRSFSVSGRVREPGVKLAPAGITARELIDEYCGGMLDGHVFAGYLPGGASGGIFPASMGDIPLDFGSFEPHGGFIGSAAIIVLSDHDGIGDAALNLLRFFRDESCGQCTPCRLGTEKAVALMEAGAWHGEPLRDLADVMADASICGLGQAAANPIRCALKYFGEQLK